MKTPRCGGMALLFVLITGVLATVGAAEDVETAISIGGVRTEAEKQAVRLLLKSVPVINAQEIMKASSEGVLYIKPSARVEVGEKDTFQNAALAAQGFYMMVDPQKPTASGWIFPYSLGFEGSRNLTSYAALAEVGITTPFRPLAGDLVLGRNIKFGIFGQAGYKFKDETPVSAGTGLRNLTREREGDTLGRLKANMGIDLASPELNGIVQGRLICSATGWYDIPNGVFYDREEVTLRISPLFLKSLFKNKHFDLSYEHGAGAPTFNRGDQFGVSLTMIY